MATVPDIPVIINWSVTPQNGEENYFDLMNTWLTESTTVIESLSDAVDAMNMANPLVYESGKAAVAAANYQGVWDNAFAGGYGKYTTVTYSDGYIYISEIANNTTEPASKTNTAEWTWFVNADPNDFYTKSQLDNGELDSRYYTETEIDENFVNKDFTALSEKTTPVDNDIFAINDSENSNNLKKLTFDSLKIGLANTWVSNDNRAKTALNANGTAPIYACRAWVNFNGQGAPAIRGSGNVSSITDQGVGKFRINFLTALEDADYSVGQTVDSDNYANSRNYGLKLRDLTYITTTYVDVHSHNEGTGAVDNKVNTLQIFR